MRSAEQRMLNAVQRPEVYREVVLDSGGARIVLSVWDGTTGMPVVLFLPGTMTHPLFYEEFLDALNRAGLTVVGLHGQGHGKSPRARRPLTFASLVENAREAVTWIRRAFPGRPLAVIGSSQGSVLAMALAAADRRIDAVFAHNVLDPALSSTIQITRFPRGLARAYPAVLAAFRAAARLAPAVPVPFGAYLDIRRVCRDESTIEYFYTDPLGRRSYPLRFMASLFTADLAGMRNGSITCPVTVIAGRGDPLFPLAYIREVYDRIVAPRKDLVVVDSDAHLLFNEDLATVLPPLLERLQAVAPAEKGAPA
ncbi:MAG TPA: alpha/beta fold hydrolase [Streptosporangiaceae bacterium]